MIPLHAAARTRNESTYLASVVESGRLGGGGPFTTACEEALQRMGAPSRAFLTSSCTGALHLAGLALGLGSGDDVVVPSYAFASCASVFAALGARVRFADSCARTPLVDPCSIERALTPSTRAILVLHYAGLACDMDAIDAIAAAHRLPVIADAAHGLTGYWRGRPLESYGTVAVASFDWAKNMTAGEGGVLFVHEPSLVPRVEMAYHRGTNRGAMLRGEVPEYEWMGAGGHYAPSELQAAFLLSQLEEVDVIQRRRRQIWQMYLEGLETWALRRGVTLPLYSDDTEPACHLMYLVFPDRREREAAKQGLLRHDIESAAHYRPLHLSPAARALGADEASCPNAARYGEGLLRVPLHTALSDEDVSRVIDVLRSL